MRVAEDGVGDDEDGVGGVGDVSHNKVEDGFCQGVGIAASHHDVVEGGDDGGEDEDGVDGVGDDGDSVMRVAEDDGGEDEDGVDSVGDDGGHHNVKSKAKLW